MLSLYCIATHMLSWITGCLALRTRNGRFKNSFIPGGTLPTHPVAPKKWKCDMMGFLTNTLQYVRLPDLKVDLLFLQDPISSSSNKTHASDRAHGWTRIFWKLKAYEYALAVVYTYPLINSHVIR